MRVAIVGGPGVGKSTLVRQLGDLYHHGSYGEGEKGVWDPRVLDIVHFDEEHRGLTFKQPVFVDFLDPQAYSERVRADETELTDEDKQQLKAEVARVAQTQPKPDTKRAANPIARRRFTISQAKSRHDPWPRSSVSSGANTPGSMRMS